MSMPLSPEAALGAAAARALLRVVTKRRAPGRLGLMAAVFVAAVLAGDTRGLLGFVRAGAEASLVGGLADWFAVTALFRHPLGLPIPHTAVIPARKAKIIESIVNMVENDWLSPGVIGTRLARVSPSTFVRDWIDNASHVEPLAGPPRDLLPRLAR